MISGKQITVRAHSQLGTPFTCCYEIIKHWVLLFFLFPPIAVIGQQVSATTYVDSTKSRGPKYSGYFYGQVWDGETRDPMAFASLRWGTTGKGGITNFEGEFNLGKGPFTSDTFWIDYLVFET